jgi:hypothetical protein
MFPGLAAIQGWRAPRWSIMPCLWRGLLAAARGFKMNVTRKLTRRSFLGRVAGGAIVGGAALTVLGGRAEAIQTTDSDSGPNADSPGHGSTGVSDRDSGPNADRAGHGRGGRSGLTDSDTGRYADPSGNGRRGRASACTDTDSGPNSDGTGHGRGSGVSDSDRGPNADPGGCGRR